MLDFETFCQLTPLNQLSEQNLSALYHTLEEQLAHRGTMLFKRGKSLAQWYFLIEGEVDLINNEFEAERVTPQCARAQYPLNEQSPSPVSAIAKTNLRYITIDMERVAAMREVIKIPDISDSHIDKAWHHLDATMEVEDLKEGVDWMSCLIQSPLFSQLPVAQLQEVFNRLENKIVAAGERVIQEGASGDYVYVIAAGSARVTHRESNVTVELKEGDLFGEEAILSQAPRNASVTMLSDGHLRRLNAEDFAELVCKPVLRTLNESPNKPNKILDVRMPIEYRTGHLADAVNMPLSKLRDQLTELSAQHLYLVDDSAGPRAKIAAYLLCQAGFDAAILQA